jgi:integrase
LKVSREGVPELRLTDAEIDCMEAVALERGDVEAFLLVGLGARRSWRISSIVGYQKHVKYRTKKGKIVEKDYALPGLRREDVGDSTVAVHRKGGTVKWEYVPEPYMSRLKELAGRTHFGERLIPWTEDHANDVLVDLATAAGIAHPERIHTHRLRHYFGTHMSDQTNGNLPQVQDLMGHKDPRATRIYIAELTPEREKELLDKSLIRSK